MSGKQGEPAPESVSPESKGKRVPDWYAREYWEWVDAELAAEWDEPRDAESRSGEEFSP